MNSKEVKFSFRPVKWLHFINDVHPIFPDITFNYFSFTAFYLFVYNFLMIGSFSWTDLILGSTTYSSLLLCIRAFDELKDHETDIVNFPNRPLVKGVVARSDLHSLTSLLLLTLLGFHLFIYQTSLPTLVYSVLVVFSFFIYKWFYLEGFLKPNLFWAFIMQAPFAYVLKFYNLSFLFRFSDSPIQQHSLLITSAFGLTSTAWEISRKLRQPREETDYLTFTKIWGKTFSTYLVQICLLASAGLFVYISWEQIINYDKWRSAPFALPLLALVLFRSKSKKFLQGDLKGIVMLKTAELYIAALTFSAFILGLYSLF